jgi:hypothetical protein
MIMKPFDWVLLLAVGVAAALFVEALATGMSVVDIISSLLAATGSL